MDGLQSFGRQQVHPEPTAFSLGRKNTDMTPHALGAFAYQRQSNTGAGVLFRVLQAVKQAEDFFMVLRSDADPIVLDPKTDAVSRCGRIDPEHWSPVGSNKLQAVRNQIPENLF